MAVTRNRFESFQVRSLWKYSYFCDCREVAKEDTCRECNHTLPPQIEYLHVNLGKSIHGRSILLHSPSLRSTVLSLGNILGNRPDGPRLAHVEASHGLLIRRKLIGVENSSASHETGVSVFLEPLGPNGRSLSSAHALLGHTRLLDSLDLLVLSGLVVGSGGKSQGLPDGVHAGRAEVGLSDEGEVDGEAREAEEGFAVGGLLGGLVHFVAEAVFVEGSLEADFGDAFGAGAGPGVVEAPDGSFQKAKVWRR